MRNICFIFVILTTCLSGCYIGKPLKVKSTMYVFFASETGVLTCINGKYAKETKWNEYKNAFIDGLKKESSYYNLVITEDEKQSADFTLVISSFNVSESLSSETVNDVASPYNGKTFQLSSCNADATFKLYKGNQEKLLGQWSANAYKDEKISNNRNFGDFVFGTNKDNSEYRYKELDDNICTTLSEKCGNHVIAKLTRKISKNK
ncbi:MAG: hypothetical protein COX07_00570 [Bacteroidetes bacterium CG23_combo_of_CG06-09_8_20_14_all_32_9]|nr:MAG: hypothetical protein COX07_00570 [Bacteroidetes bacterium CG23_combo_of_CG06-09_8_20_14_all_32_9]